jgi:hypothetical protein
MANDPSELVITSCVSLALGDCESRSSVTRLDSILRICGQKVSTSAADRTRLHKFMQELHALSHRDHIVLNYLSLLVSTA